MGVQGFPTLKIIRPSKKPGKPVVEDYQGARSAKAIVDAVIDKIPNHVKRLGDKELDDWLRQGNDTSKAILFSDKGTTSALLKSLAVDFLGVIQIAQIRDKEKAATNIFGISTFPTFILLPGGDRDGLIFDGEMKKNPLVSFLSQVAEPNPDPAPPKSKTSKKSDQDKTREQKKSAENSSAFSAASASHASAEASEAAASATSIVVDEASNPTESPDPIVNTEGAPSPAPLPDVPPPIPTLFTQEELQTACLSAKSSTCLLALLPTHYEAQTTMPDGASAALVSLATLADKHAHRNSKIFPFYAIPAENPGAGQLREVLGLKGEGEIEILAVNARRVWWKRYEGTNYGLVAVEDWFDGIRLGEGKKEKLPDSLVRPDGERNEEHDEL
jgi:protein disulfide-isomerase A6